MSKARFTVRGPTSRRSERSPKRAELALDMGAGGGHVSYALARHARRVIATDLSSEMLAAVARTAREKGLSNIETARSPGGASAV